MNCFLRFGSFEIDVVSGELRKDGRLVEWSGAGKIVKREEIQQAS